MTTLVTGATGRVGSRFVPRLLADGERTRVVVRDAEAGRPLAARGAELAVGDLRHEDTLRKAVEGVDAVVHLAAAFRGVPDAEAVAVNRDATVALSRAAIEVGVRRFVFASTSLVYGSGLGRPAHGDDAPAPAPDVAYPQSKAQSETALRDITAGSSMGLRILRLAFVYGEGDPHLAESLMWAKDWPTSQRLHLVHHADVGQALIRTLRTDGIDGACLNVADDAPVTMVELHQLNHEPIPADAHERTLDDPWHGILDNSDTRRVLGFRPIFPTVYTAKDAGAL